MKRITVLNGLLATAASKAEKESEPQYAGRRGM